MDRFRIVGPCRLSGEVEAAGANNAVLPAVAGIYNDNTFKRFKQGLLGYGLVGRAAKHQGHDQGQAKTPNY